MYSFLRRPSWIALALVVIALTVLFVRLGVWQLDRLDERRVQNATVEARLGEVPADLEDLPTTADYDSAAAEFEFRRAALRGTYVPADEVLVRSQTLQGEAGFHVLTPLMTERGTAVLVNRGWVPLGEDTPPVSQGPPLGEQRVELVLQGTQVRGSIGPTDPPDGRVAQLSRVDLARVQRQLDYPVMPVYGLLVDETIDLPRPVTLTELNEGTHLSYAIQWFSFAAISVGGFAALVRTTSQRKNRSSVTAVRDGISSNA